MTPSQAVGYALNQTTTITALVSTRINFGNRPDGTITPCINFFEMPGGYKRNGLNYLTYSINCRAVTAETAMQVANLVDTLFNGSAGTGVYGSWNTFGIARASTRQRQGLIYESGENIYNAPVDVFIVCPANTN
jgi:hypothetical protein